METKEWVAELTGHRSAVPKILCLSKTVSTHSWHGCRNDHKGKLMQIVQQNILSGLFFMRGYLVVTSRFDRQQNVLDEEKENS